MREVVIVAAKRTAVGTFMGSLATSSAVELGSVVIKALLEETQVEAKQISEVIMGQVLTAGAGQNPARQAAIHAGVALETSALTINQVCGSGLKAVYLAMQAIMLGDAEIVIAGGQENMSLGAYILPGVRGGYRMGNATVVDSMVYDGLTDVYNQYHMGVTAENVAAKYNISRKDQDLYAVNSQNKAEVAIASGKFNDEIVPVMVKQKKGDPLKFVTDEFVRKGVSYEALSALKPAFDKTNGTVTAGNASGINDGAAAVMLMTKEIAVSLGLTPLVVIKAGATAGLEPKLMGMGPVYATRKVLAKAAWEINSLDVIEANEAFAAQAVAVNRELGWDVNKVNVNGGAIAIGHPIGASGCRILVTLIHEMLRQKASRGLATLCVGGGMGVALALARE